ncbi:hypothetical protein EDC96DRAFT_551419 [Choanephora cucurbitarum]|nr:hypothetical protein EDC96DRAFT_551419 [Choanephora cucurbitarum]
MDKSVPPIPQSHSSQASDKTSLHYPQGATFSSLPPDATVVNYDSNAHPEKPVLLRAGLDTKQRLLLMTSVGGFWGFGIGAFLGARHSGLQYLAENAHKLPTTVQGWYFYHKTKNYRMMLGGVKRGVRFAGKTGGLCLLYGAIESAMDDIRGEPDLLNSVAAGVTTGTVFSALSNVVWNFFQEIEIEIVKRII